MCRHWIFLVLLLMLLTLVIFRKQNSFTRRRRASCSHVSHQAIWIYAVSWALPQCFQSGSAAKPPAARGNERIICTHSYEIFMRSFIPSIVWPGACKAYARLLGTSDISFYLCFNIWLSKVILGCNELKNITKTAPNIKTNKENILYLLVWQSQ